MNDAITSLRKGLKDHLCTLTTECIQCAVQKCCDQKEQQQESAVSAVDSTSSFLTMSLFYCFFSVVLSYFTHFQITFCFCLAGLVFIMRFKESLKTWQSS